jgi:membrane protease subunit HflC
MAQQTSTNRHRVLRRTLLALAAAVALWALAASVFALDVTEYGLVTRFGRVTRVVDEPGLHVALPFDQVVRLDKRILFFRPAPSEYLTVDKKNFGVDSLVAWRIADAQKFLATLATPAAAEQHLADVILAEIGAVLGRSPASALTATDPANSRYQAVATDVAHRVADLARTSYGIEVISVDICRLYPPDVNREHVFERMKAERARIAKENRSAGELEAKKIIAAADHEKVRIDADAVGEAERIKAAADAEASGVYAAAFAQDPKFYKFVRTLSAYDKVLDDKTTLFLPADADVLRMLQLDTQPAEAAPSLKPPRNPPDSPSTGADLLLNRKPGEVR